MKSIIRNLVLGAFFVLMIASPIMAAITPQAVSAAACSEDRFLGIPPWYRGLTETNTRTTPVSCTIVSPANVGGLNAFIWKIVLNVVEMAIVATTYLTIFFLLYGGFLFITGGNNPSQIEKGRKTILNAVIGLVLCIAAIALTNLIFRIIT